MIALLQRVKRSWVSVEGIEIASIHQGYNILLGVMKDDSIEDISKLINKIVHLRVFADENGKMNLSILDIEGEALVVSQFTLAASVKKGRRPSFESAMPPKEAKGLYKLFCEELQKHIPVSQGEFGAMMEVDILNDGPVTIIIDSKEI